MTDESSAETMDAIFAAPEEEPRSMLLKIVQEFLESEAIKQADREKGSLLAHHIGVFMTGTLESHLRNKAQATQVNMEEFVGNTHGFAESGCVTPCRSQVVD